MISEVAPHPIPYLPIMSILQSNIWKDRNVAGGQLNRTNNP